MKVVEYQTIYTIKESEKAKVVLATIDGREGPVVVKRLKGVKPDIYQFLAQIHNPHIPEVYAYEVTEQELIVAEEYVDGENLTDYIQKVKPVSQEIINLALQLCEVVQYLHSMNPPVIHRDIKPSNIIITGEGVLKLIDFDASRQYKKENTGSDTRLLGTAAYAPPEQFGYSQTDARSDIYSMGVVFHEMSDVQGLSLPATWKKMVSKCTSFDPGNRYQNVHRLEREIKKMMFLHRLPGKALGGVIVLLVLGIAIRQSFLWLRPAREAGEAELTGVPSLVVELPDGSLTGGVPGGSPIADVASGSPTVGVQGGSPIMEMLSGLPTEGVPSNLPTAGEPDTSPTEDGPIYSQTPILTPTPTLTPEEKAKRLEQEWAYIEEHSFYVHDYYPYLEDCADWYIYTTSFEPISEINTVFLYLRNCATGEVKEVTLDSSQYRFEHSVLIINKEYFKTLDDSLYFVSVDTLSECFDTYINLHHDGNPVDVSKIECNWLGYKIGKYQTVHTHVNSVLPLQIINLMTPDGEPADANLFRTYNNGKILEIDAELLDRYADKKIVGFTCIFNDGSRERLTIEYEKD